MILSFSYCFCLIIPAIKEFILLEEAMLILMEGRESHKRKDAGEYEMQSEEMFIYL